MITSRMDEAQQNRLIRKIAIRIMPLVSVGFLLSYLDRTNISMAALTMNSDLRLTSAAYGWAVSLFFVTYIACEIPSNAALQRFGARVWLSRIMVTWGIITCATAFSWNVTSLYAFRLLLGAAESGFAIGVVYYFTTLLHGSLWPRLRYGDAGAVPRHFRGGLSCRSKPVPSVVTTSRSSGTGPRTLLTTMRPCGKGAA